MLQLQHDFYNIVFKLEHKLCIASGSGPPPLPKMKNSGCAVNSNYGCVIKHYD